jgi:molybdopterin converting factor small subunit
MRVTVLCFGILKELLDGGDEAVDLPESATVGSLLEVLRGRTSNSPVDERVWQSLAVAVNREYAAASQRLREGDEVALLPPVSGGDFALGGKLASLPKTLGWGLACAD